MTTQCKKCNYQFNPLIALICTLTGLFGAVAIVGLLLDSFAVLCAGVSLFGVLTLGVFTWELVRASMSYHKYRTGNASDSKVKQVLIADICCSVVAILVAMAFVALTLLLNLLTFEVAVQIAVKCLLVLVVAYLIVVGAMFDYFAKYRKNSSCSCETQTTAVVAESQPAVEEVKTEESPVVAEEKPVAEPVAEEKPTEPVVEEKPAEPVTEQPSVEPVEQKAEEQPAPQAEPTVATTAPKKTTSTKSTSTASKSKSSSTSKSSTSKSKSTTPKE